MTGRSGLLRGSAAAALAAAAALTPAVAEAQAVGVLAAVNRQVVGERPSEPPRQLVLSEELITDERVQTSASGGGQVLFIDQTSLTLTPNSDIVLDRYLYDPESQTGDLSVSILKGAMRFVGGRITKTSAATIRTPSATIGIRGGIGSVVVDAEGGVDYIHIAGISSTITNAAGTVTVTREGGSVRVPAPSAGGTAGAPTYQGVAGPEAMAASFGLGTGDGDGGVTRPADAAAVAPRIEPIELEVSRKRGATVSAPIGTTGERETASFEPPPPELGELPLDELADDRITDDIVREIENRVDGLAFSGTWDAFTGLRDGNFILTQRGLAVEIEYSLDDRVGLATVELPSGSGDVYATLDLSSGAQIAGDRFIVIGDETRRLGGDPVNLSRLRGDASDSALAISMDNVLSGAIFIDYAGSDLLPNTAFVDGAIASPIRGARADGGGIARRVIAESRRD